MVASDVTSRSSSSKKTFFINAEKHNAAYELYRDAGVREMQVDINQVDPVCCVSTP